MSWSQRARGTVESVRAHIIPALESERQRYIQTAAVATDLASRSASLMEAADIAHAILSIGLALDAHNAQGPSLVEVEAAGSRSAGYAYASMSVVVRQVNPESTT